MKPIEHNLCLITTYTVWFNCFANNKQVNTFILLTGYIFVLLTGYIFILLTGYLFKACKIQGGNVCQCNKINNYFDLCYIMRRKWLDDLNFFNQLVG